MTVALFVALIVWTALGLSTLPVVLFLMNRGVFTRAPHPRNGEALPPLSVLIPARNEAAGIERACRAVLASRHVDLQLIVMDDHSTDDTAAIVQRLADEDPRVQLATAPPLPGGWAGKQHACWQLAQLASPDRPLLVWLDADVRLEPDALARMATFQQRSGAALVSGFPRQETRTLAERLVVPQINLVLVGYLPMMMMRLSTSPGFAAANGQWIMATRDAYQRTGGHGSELVRASFHDGVKLPRLFRQQGLRTDVFDGNDAATCRMYDSAPAVWNGFAKNATEGMAGPIGVWVWTALLLGGHVLPWLLLLGYPLLPASSTCNPAHNAAIIAAAAQSAAVSAWCAAWFRQGVLAALLRPLGVTVLVTIQWHAYLRKLLRRPPTWRGRPASA